MLRIVGIDKVIENVIALSYSYSNERNFSFSKLKESYKRFLQHIQPAIPKGGSGTIEFVRDSHLTAELIEIFDEKSRLDDFDEIFSGEESLRLENLKKAEKYYQDLQEIDRNLFSLFSLVINIVFSGPSDIAGGGSTSGAVGCIWVNPRPSWSSQDFIEFFIHEMTHNLVFLDEYRFHHYTSYSQMLSEENYTISAILSRKRPLDKVFHSIMVSTEVLLSRCDLLGHPEVPKLHPPSEILFEKTCKSIEALENFPQCYNLLTARGKELIALCKVKMSHIESCMNLKTCDALQ